MIMLIMFYTKKTIVFIYTEYRIRIQNTELASFVYHAQENNLTNNRNT